MWCAVEVQRKREAVADGAAALVAALGPAKSDEPPGFVFERMPRIEEAPVIEGQKPAVAPSGNGTSTGERMT